MTLEQILMAIQANVDRSNDPIEWSDEDTVVRIELVNTAIDRWAEDNTTEWAELYTNTIIGTVKAGNNSFNLDDDFQFVQGVYLENGEEIAELSAAESAREGRYFYVSGNKAEGYSINLGWQPSDEDSAVGQKLRVIYYRSPQYLAKPNDVPEMSIPRFIVHFVSAELMIDDDTTQYGKYSNDATLDLANMRQQNDRRSGFTSSHNALDDDMEGLG